MCPGPTLPRARVSDLEVLTERTGESQVDEFLNLYLPVRISALISLILCIEDLYIILFIKITLLLKECWTSPTLHGLFKQATPFSPGSSLV